jgi:hypothetical protein
MADAANLWRHGDKTSRRKQSLCASFKRRRFGLELTKDLWRTGNRLWSDVGKPPKTGR